MHDLARVLVKHGQARRGARGLPRAGAAHRSARHRPIAASPCCSRRRTSRWPWRARAARSRAPAELAKPKAAPRPRLDEAIAYLREARQRPPTQLAGDVLLSLALALDRAGAREEADAALDRGAPRGRACAAARRRATSRRPRTAAALEALAAEGSRSRGRA